MTALHAVIMAGGSGTRFWPASRKRRPKQFLPLAHGVPLLQATVLRLRELVPPERLWIVTNAVQAAALPALLPDFATAQILIEPEPRDTAPCLCLAAASIGARDADATMIVLPADHIIEPLDAFTAMLRRGIALAQDQVSLVTFGITPSHAATGYGYIECGEPVDTGEPVAHLARRFREKPDAETARGFVQAGNFLWNSGIFVWTLAALRTALQHGDAALAPGLAAMQQALQHGDGAAAARHFLQLPKTSIDYAVMERAPRVVVVRAGVRWDDVGAFPALAAVAPRDGAGNASVLADGATQMLLESRDNIVYAEGRRLVALFGVSDLVVVAVGDAVLVCAKDKAEDLKRLVDHLQKAGRSDLL